MRAQINPHFLFNALNTIAALIRTEPFRAEAITEELADLFRYVLHASRRSMASLAEEVRCAKIYLTIEEARFEDRLRVVFKIPEALHGISAPS